MTRVAVLSDIHGNLPALEAVLSDVQRKGVEGIIVAGDYTGGPRPQETTDLLRSLGSWMIRGNTEDYCLDYDRGNAPAGWRESKQWAAMRWSYSRLSRETLDFIASLPQQCVVAPSGTAPIRVVHGSPRSPTEHLFPDRDPVVLEIFREAGILPRDTAPTRLSLALAQIEEPVLVCGHSHIPWTQEQDGRLAVNAGSVGASINGHWHAQYAMLSWRNGRWWVEHRFIAYDLDQIRAAYRDSGYLAGGGAFAQACLMEIESGQNVPGHFVSYVYEIATEAGLEHLSAVPDSIWDQAVTTFNWEIPT
jgi:predicted phosphodiesterase